MRLIDADALANNITVLFEKNKSLIDEWLRYQIEDEITEAPTIDMDLLIALVQGLIDAIPQLVEMIPTILDSAEPVRHGYWDDTRVAFYRKCSECGATVKNNLPDVFLDYDIRDLHYCPNCGAKMDEENEE